jgi:hypothetical protein
MRCSLNAGLLTFDIIYDSLFHRSWLVKIQRSPQQSLLSKGRRVMQEAETTVVARVKGGLPPSAAHAWVQAVAMRAQTILEWRRVRGVSYLFPTVEIILSVPGCRDRVMQAMRELAPRLEGWDLEFA